MLDRHENAPKTTRILLATALVLALGGCRLGAGESCSVDTDCEDGLVCNLYSLQCSEPKLVCESDSDCDDPALSHCGEENECVAPPSVGGTDVSTPADTTGRTDTSGGLDLLVPDVPSADLQELPCPEPPAEMLRATVFLIGTSGRPGFGLDVDGEATTCAPSVDCSDGVDNALAPLGQLANATLALALTEQDLNILFGAEPVAPASCPFVLYTRSGRAPAAEGGSYAVLPATDGASCPPGAVFTDACLSDATITAGFAGDAVFTLFLPLFDVVLEIPIREARLHGTVTKTGGDALASFAGIVAGVVLPAELDAAIDQIPTEALPGGLDPKVLVHSMVTNDIDTDGDGTADAFSVGLQIEATPVSVSGLAESR